MAAKSERERERERVRESGALCCQFISLSQQKRSVLIETSQAGNIFSSVSVSVNFCNCKVHQKKKEKRGTGNYIRIWPFHLRFNVHSKSRAGLRWEKPCLLQSLTWVWMVSVSIPIARKRLILAGLHRFFWPVEKGYKVLEVLMGRFLQLDRARLAVWPCPLSL